MSIPVSQLVAECTRAVGDATKSRVTEADWLLFYNDTLEEMTSCYRILEQDATFDVVADEDRYLYPDDCVQVKRLQYSATPSDVDSYVQVPEMFEDEMRRAEWAGKSTGDQFTGYWARSQFFQLTPKPTTTVSDGGLVSYWKLAARLDVVGEAVLEIPASLRQLVRMRMVIYAKQRLDRYDALQSDIALWTALLEQKAEAMLDRSDDRRTQFRPKSAMRGFGGMS